MTQCEERKSGGKKILISQKFYSESVLKFPYSYSTVNLPYFLIYVHDRIGSILPFTQIRSGPSALFNSESHVLSSQVGQ